MRKTLYLDFFPLFILFLVTIGKRHTFVSLYKRTRIFESFHRIKTVDVDESLYWIEDLYDVMTGNNRTIQ